MAVYKCKMCGGPLEINGNDLITICEYCDTKQTVPKSNDEVVANLFNRANNLRLKSEFDKAAEIYEKIINENSKEAEAYWGLVLCKYGVEYVEDPKTFKRIPTCHRTQYESILTDVDFLAVLENSTGVQKELYQSQAEEIAVLQKDVLEIVKKEKPFDVFICYKETDENGKRTIDSALANDIYYQLTQEGMKVFYSAITLENKLGHEYEPYIFAALNSAKVMLVVGTKPEYFESVWVKNEWSRFLKLMKNDRSKLLIPCYRDMDAYDLPEEFSHIQAQDMAKIGFVNDVVRGIRKIVSKPEKTTAVKEAVVVASNADANIEPLLKRAFLFLEDGEFETADEYCEKVLDADPECAEAYLGKLMVELRLRKREQLRDCLVTFDSSNSYQKAYRFGDDELKKELKEYIMYIAERMEKARVPDIYDKALEILRSNKSTITKLQYASKLFDSIKGFEDADELAEICLVKADSVKKDYILVRAMELKKEKNIQKHQQVIEMLETIPGWKNADRLHEECVNELKKMQEMAWLIKLKEICKKFPKYIKMAAFVASVLALLWVLWLLIFG